MTRNDRLILLAIRQGPAFGLEIRERVKAETGGEVDLGQATLYPALRNLERDGLLESYEVEAEPGTRGGYPRRYYKLTGCGQTAALAEPAASELPFALPVRLIPT